MNGRLLVWLLSACLITTGCVADDDDPQDDDTTDDDDDSADDDDNDDDTTDPDPYIQPDVHVTPAAVVPGEPATVHYQGSLSAATHLVMSYGYNGYNLVEGMQGYVEIPEYGNTDYLLYQEMTAVAGGFEAAIDVPADVRVLHFTFSDPDMDVLDDNGGQHYHWGVVFPTIGPYLTWPTGAFPHDSIAVNFETSVPCLGHVEYGTTSDLGTAVYGDELATLHHIRLTGLLPDTTYHYRVFDSAANQSQTYTFRTAPELFDTMTFAVLADPQDNGEDDRWPGVIDELIANHPAVELLVLPGDLAANNKPGLWWCFFDGGRELFAGVPLLPAVGNHDTPGVGSNPDVTTFTTYFDLPATSGSEAHYRVDYGPATFLTLNSEDLDGVQPGGAQQVWLEPQLADIASGSASWVFAQWHVPPYDAALRLYEEQWSVRPLTAQLDGVVDWVFSGHEHLAQRTHPLQYEGQLAPSGLYGNGAADGVGYLVAPTAGNANCDNVVPYQSADAALRNLMAFPALAPDQNSVDSQVGFVIVAMAGASITLQTWGLGATEIPTEPVILDEVSYSK